MSNFILEHNVYNINFVDIPSNQKAYHDIFDTKSFPLKKWKVQSYTFMGLYTASNFKTDHKSQLSLPKCNSTFSIVRAQLALSEHEHNDK